jgi:hypothetical protein
VHGDDFGYAPDLVKSADLANQLGLSPLVFEGRDEWRERHSVSSSLLAGSSAASLAISSALHGFPTAPRPGTGALRHGPLPPALSRYTNIEYFDAGELFFD